MSSGGNVNPKPPAGQPRVGCLASNADLPYSRIVRIRSGRREALAVERNSTPEQATWGALQEARWPIAVFVAARLFLTALGVVLFALGMVPPTDDPILRPYLGLAPVVDGWRGPLLGVWLRFDAVHYLRIAEHGYAANDLSVFYPLYPLMVRVAGWLLGGDQLLGALLVSNGAAAAALVLFHRWVREEFGDEGLARRATVYLMAFPTAFFLLAPYPESLSLLFTLLALRAYRCQRWLWAGAAGLAASTTRPQGAILSAVLLVDLLLRRRGGQPLTAAGLLAPAGPLLGVVAFLGYRAWLHFPPMSEVQLSHWGRVTALPFAAIVATVQRLAAGTASAIELVDLGAVILMLVLGVVAVRRLPALYAIYHWSLLLLNLSLVRLPQPISSQARFALGLFTAFPLLARMGSSARANRLILYPSLGLGALLAGEFVLWGWVG